MKKKIYVFVVLLLIGLVTYQTIRVSQAETRANQYQGTLAALVGVLRDMEQTAEARIDKFPKNVELKPQQHIVVSKRSTIDISHYAYGVDQHYTIYFGGVVDKQNGPLMGYGTDTYDWSHGQPLGSEVTFNDLRTYEGWWDKSPSIKSEN